MIWPFLKITFNVYKLKEKVHVTHPTAGFLVFEKKIRTFLAGCSYLAGNPPNSHLSSPGGGEREKLDLEYFTILMAAYNKFSAL